MMHRGPESGRNRDDDREAGGHPVTSLGGRILVTA
jgi:hypothetical protein